MELFIDREFLECMLLYRKFGTMLKPFKFLLGQWRVSGVLQEMWKDSLQKKIKCYSLSAIHELIALPACYSNIQVYIIPGVVQELGLI